MERRVAAVEAHGPVVATDAEGVGLEAFAARGPPFDEGVVFDLEDLFNSKDL